VHALHAFKGRRKEELTFKAGDQLTILEKVDDEWYRARDDQGVTGYAPIKFVDETPEDRDARKAREEASVVNQPDPAPSKNPSVNDYFGWTEDEDDAPKKPSSKTPTNPTRDTDRGGAVPQNQNSVENFAKNQRKRARESKKEKEARF
jgi:hypothetical protein